MFELMAHWRRITRAQRRFWRMTALLAVVCSALYLLGHARYGLFDVDEAIFTEATIEMRASGSLAMPTYNGEPRYHKPPLIYWAQDAAMTVFGEDSLFAARLPSALGALGTILLLGIAVAKMTGSRRWGLMAAMVMGLNLSFLVVGRAATADGLLNVTSVALALWVIHVMYPGQLVLRDAHEDVNKQLLHARIQKAAAEKTYRSRQWMVTALLGAAGFLAKGPVAWIPAILIVLVVLFFHRQKLVIWRRVAPVKVGLLLVALLVPWVGMLLAQHGWEFFYEFFIVHNFGRYAGGLSNTQSSSPFYYLAVLLAGFFPWVFVLPKALQMMLKGGIRRVRRALNGDDPGPALPLLALAWAVGYIVFFSFSQTKLAHYIVPAYPALAIVAAGFLAQIPRMKVSPLVMTLGAFVGVFFGALMLVLNPVLMALREPTLHGWMGWLQAALNFEWPPHDPVAVAVLAQPIELSMAAPLVGIVMLLAVVPSWFLVARGQRSGAIMLAGSWAICLGLIAGGVVPQVWRYTQSALADAARVIADAAPTTPIVHLGVHKPSVLYLSHRRFTKLENPLQLPDYITEAETLVLTEQDKVLPIVRELGIKGGAQVLGQRCSAGYCLLNVARPMLPSGVIDTGAPTTP